MQLRQCNVCGVHASGAVQLDVCSRCQATLSCSCDHQNQDFPSHRTLCGDVKAARENLAKAEAQLRMESESVFDYVPDNVFETHVGRFDQVSDTGLYMVARRTYIQSLGSPEALAMALDEAMGSLRLSRQDKHNARDGIPVIPLRLGELQQCYDFIKWWTLVGETRRYQQWSDLTLPYCRPPRTSTCCSSTVGPAATQVLEAAVVVRVDAYGHNPHILWAAAMSLAHATTTNNQAEYFGLLTGLRFASTRRLGPLTVIGDSAMILQQLRTYKAPKHPTLRQLYGQARILADTLHVAAWCHHLRAYNKMADSAANIAMDTRQSRQTLFPTQQAHWAPIATHLRGDVEQWQVSTSTGHADAS